MLSPENVQLAKVYVPAAALIISIVAAILALLTFRQNERWKKAEFLAKEMKDFFTDERVQKL